MGYEQDNIWHEIQKFFPMENRLSEENMPREYFLDIGRFRVHIDHYEVDEPKATVILFHGAGGNGRLMSFIALPFVKAGFEVLSPDMPLYGHTEYSGVVTYDDWLDCGKAIIERCRESGNRIFLLGLSIGGMFAYQMAGECNGISGIMATCLIDQGDMEVLQATAKNPILARAGRPLMKLLHKPLANLKLPLEWLSKMEKITNEPVLMYWMLKDKTAAGVRAPLSFIHSMTEPKIKILPENFERCPLLLVHPEKDAWTDISLSKKFYERLACEKEIKLLEGAGHLPIEPLGLKQMEQACIEFMNRICMEK